MTEQILEALEAGEQLTLFHGFEADGLPPPIPAKCPKCRYDWVDKDAIRAPSLSGCCCFWCHSLLRPHRGRKDFALADRHDETRGGRAFASYLRLDALCQSVNWDTERLWPKGVL